MRITIRQVRVTFILTWLGVSNSALAAVCAALPVAYRVPRRLEGATGGRSASAQTGGGRFTWEKRFLSVFMIAVVAEKCLLWCPLLGSTLYRAVRQVTSHRGIFICHRLRPRQAVLALLTDMVSTVFESLLRLAAWLHGCY